MKILVVDDHALIREAVHGVLKSLTRGAVVLEASNYAQAMEVIASHSDIRLILLDLTLPDREGFSMLADVTPTDYLGSAGAFVDRALEHYRR